MEYVDKFYATLNSNKLVSTILTTFLIVYASHASPKLPGVILNLFNHKIFKIIVLSFVAYSSARNPKISLLIALIFSISLTLLDQKKFFEGFTENPQQNCPENINEKDINKTNYKHLCCCDITKNAADAENIPICLDAIEKYGSSSDIKQAEKNYRKHVCGND